MLCDRLSTIEYRSVSVSIVIIVPNLILGYSRTEQGDKKSGLFMIEEIIIQRYVGNNQQFSQSSLN